MTQENRLAAAFEQARPHLRAVAFRLLGSVADADDAVQDAWLRVAGHDLATVDNPTGWLTTVVSRLCLDALRARRRRGAEPWPQSTMSDGHAAAPEEQHELAESVGLAMLVVLDRLTPRERVAFVLHDTFALPFDTIATTLDQTVVATKKLASRARRRIYGAPSTAPGSAARYELVEAFLAASRTGDVEALLAILAPRVVRRADAAARDQSSPTELRGADAVAREIATNAARARFARALLVDGVPGAVVAPAGRLRFVLQLGVSAGCITALTVSGTEPNLASLELRLLPADI